MAITASLIYKLLILLIVYVCKPSLSAIKMTIHVISKIINVTHYIKEKDSDGPISFSVQFFSRYPSIPPFPTWISSNLYPSQLRINHISLQVRCFLKILHLITVPRPPFFLTKLTLKSTVYNSRSGYSCIIHPLFTLLSPVRGFLNV